MCKILIKNNKHSNFKHLAPRLVLSSNRALFGSTSTSTTSTSPSILGSEEHENANEQHPTTQPSPSPSCRLLSMNVLSKIKKDLKRADLNGDGKLDFEELKAVFRRHDCFSDQEAEQVGELFFVGNCGRPVSHATFLRAIQYQYNTAQQQHNPPHGHSHHVQYAYPNPLHLVSVQTKSCWVSPQSDETQYMDIPKEFDRLLLKYIEDLIKHNDNENESDN
jgi:hypothetical protein